MSNCANKRKASAHASERGKRTKYPTDRARLPAPSSALVCWEVVNGFCAELTGIPLPILQLAQCPFSSVLMLPKRAATWSFKKQPFPPDDWGVVLSFYRLSVKAGSVEPGALCQTRELNWRWEVDFCSFLATIPSPQKACLLMSIWRSQWGGGNFHPLSPWDLGSWLSCFIVLFLLCFFCYVLSIQDSHTTHTYWSTTTLPYCHHHFAEKWHLSWGLLFILGRGCVSLEIIFVHWKLICAG